MEARWEVQVLPYVGTTPDDYGNEVASFAPPVTRYVYGWSPAGGVEVNTFRHAVAADLAVYAPNDLDVRPRYRMVVDGKTYDVQGEVEDYNHGPFGYAPGVVVNLTRSEA